ncbi:hypothetical protein KGMB01110_20170 [Mediterraneibacter butyricigenes]|jgi:hypothetical protein|uniref:Uncharacterized protein n=1 Tax=Mediterraneibacter butyricigenes TaxID=2316025 RepID=A0A391P1Q4_9FIRM|nr:hypothetical protein [Mediterraneibacter butyricigenes]RGO24592.1 hypothetical protein DXB23_09470 [Dorea sp. OM02-2LB]RGV96922.1 hypothetical protein DWV97_06045 [Ruminococcus sp. AF14-10]GCA67581.1 hypothetical protein KGMB01110_20170 [Mediterraneibacter butyricigenes]
MSEMVIRLGEWDFEELENGGNLTIELNEPLDCKKVTRIKIQNESVTEYSHSVKIQKTWEEEWEE